MMDSLSGPSTAKLVDVTPKKRQLEEINTKKAETGGFVHTHHFNDGSKHETHLSSTAKAAGRHVAKHFASVARGAEPTPDDSAAGAAGDAAGAATPMGEMPGQGA